MSQQVSSRTVSYRPSYHSATGTSRSSKARTRPHRTISLGLELGSPTWTLEPRALLTTFTVTNASDGPAGAAPANSLRWTVEVAEAFPGSLINIQAGVNPVLTNGAVDLPIFARIDCQGDSITAQAGHPAFTTEGPIVIQNGTIITSGAPAIVATNQLDVSNCTLVGGGISATPQLPCTVSMEDSTLKNIPSTAASFPVSGSDHVILDNDTWLNDSGTLLNYSGPASSSLTVTNCNLQGNNVTATTPGVQIAGSATVSNSIISSNQFAGQTFGLQSGTGESITFTGDTINNNRSGLSGTVPAAGVVQLSDTGTFSLNNDTVNGNTTTGGKPEFLVNGSALDYTSGSTVTTGSTFTGSGGGTGQTGGGGTGQTGGGGTGQTGGGGTGQTGGGGTGQTGGGGTGQTGGGGTGQTGGGGGVPAGYVLVNGDLIHLTGHTYFVNVNSLSPSLKYVKEKVKVSPHHTVTVQVPVVSFKRTSKKPYDIVSEEVVIAVARGQATVNNTKLVRGDQIVINSSPANISRVESFFNKITSIVGVLWKV